MRRHVSSANSINPCGFSEASRLDFLLDKDAFLMRKRADGGLITYQLYFQDDDENFICLHDDSHFFPTARQAIDAAICSAGIVPVGSRSDQISSELAVAAIEVTSEMLNRGADAMREALPRLNSGRSYQYVAGEVFKAMQIASPAIPLEKK
jgi:hypothetical protein